MSVRDNSKPDLELSGRPYGPYRAVAVVRVGAGSRAVAGQAVRCRRRRQGRCKHCSVASRHPIVLRDSA